MKSLSLFAAFYAVAQACFSQGTVVFDNMNLTTGQAPVLLIGEVTGMNHARGTNYAAQLYSAAGDQRSNLAALQPAGERLPFRQGLNHGFVALSGVNPFTGNEINQEVVVTSTLNGAATIQMRVWQGQYNTYESAVAAGGIFSFSDSIFLATTGGGLLPAVELAGLQGFGPLFLIPEPNIPEPATVAIAITLVALVWGSKIFY